MVYEHLNRITLPSPTIAQSIARPNTFVFLVYDIKDIPCNFNRKIVPTTYRYMECVVWLWQTKWNQITALLSLICVSFPLFLRHSFWENDTPLSVVLLAIWDWLLHENVDCWKFTFFPHNFNGWQPNKQINETQHFVALHIPWSTRLGRRKTLANVIEWRVLLDFRFVRIFWFRCGRWKQTLKALDSPYVCARMNEWSVCTFPINQFKCDSLRLFIRKVMTMRMCECAHHVGMIYWLFISIKRLHYRKPLRRAYSVDG